MRRSRLPLRSALLLPLAGFAAAFTVAQEGPAPLDLPGNEGGTLLPEATPDRGEAPQSDAPFVVPGEVPEAAEGASGVENVEPDALPPDLAEAMSGRGCTAWDARSEGLDASFRADLGDGVKLWAIVCDMGPTTSHALFLDRDEGVEYEPLLFADYQANQGWTGTDRLFNIAFEGGGLVLTAHRDGDVEDCGMAASWSWAGGVFRLERFLAQQECDGPANMDDLGLIYERER